MSEIEKKTPATHSERFFVNVEEKRKLGTEKYRETVSIKYRGIYDRAVSGRSRAAGVVAFCQMCLGYNVEDIRTCTSWSCPLWVYRPYQKSDDDPEIHDDVIVPEAEVPK